jgi:outer membrane protein assembly factor BamA
MNLSAPLSNENLGLFFWNGMFVRFCILLVTIAVLSPIVLSASVDGVVVEKIVVTGNKVTDTDVILREMRHRIGGRFTAELLPYERDRIYSLGLFNRVEIFHAVREGSATIFVDVHERWYIFPVPVIGIKDRDWRKFYYGLGVVHNNFRGRNEKVMGAFALGYDPWFSAMYNNPALFGNKSFFFETQFTYTNTKNRSVVYEQERQGFKETWYLVNLTPGVRLSLFTTLSLTLGYRAVNLSQNIPGHTKSPDGSDSFFFSSLVFRYDTRDITEYPMYGTYVRVSFSKSGFGVSDVDHFRTLIDLRQYVPLAERFSIAARLHSSIAGGTRLPRYNHMFIGYEEKVRGHFREIYEGENLFLSSVEARFRLLGPKYYEWKDAIVPEFSIFRYGVNLALFGDMGNVWYRDDTLREFKPVKGFGAGIHLLLPYSGVLRFEYAFNESLRGEFIMDLFVIF